jgi:hypothetical protein
MLNDFDSVNAILAQLADEGTIEPMIEPIDSSAEHVDFWDWADIIGVVDEFVPNDPFWAMVN